MTEHENIFIRILKRLGIITEFEVSKEDMCKQAQSICNHDCEHCAWQTETCFDCEYYEPKGYCNLDNCVVSPNHKCGKFIEIKPYEHEIKSRSYERVYGAKAVIEDEPQSEYPRCAINGTPFDECGFCEHFNCDTCKCEPQTERGE